MMSRRHRRLTPGNPARTDHGILQISTPACDNHYIHILDSVLVPPGQAPSEAAGSALNAKPERGNARSLNSAGDFSDPCWEDRAFLSVPSRPARMPQNAAGPSDSATADWFAVVPCGPWTL